LQVIPSCWNFSITYIEEKSMGQKQKKKIKKNEII
jgi:hypothetical protein